MTEEEEYETPVTVHERFISVAYANPRIHEDLGPRIVVLSVAWAGRAIVGGYQHGITRGWRVPVPRCRVHHWVTRTLELERLSQLAPILK